MKVLVAVHHRFDLWNAPGWFVDRLREQFPQLQVIHLSGYEGLEEAIGDAEVLLAWSLRPEQFLSALRLRWIHSPAAAVHQLMFSELINSDVVVTNAREVHGPVVAEHVIALIFALAKKIPESVRAQQNREWAQQRLWEQPPRPREVAGATLGMIGLGSIGRAVAARAASLGMRVLAVREHPEKGHDTADQVFGPDRLDEVLAAADYVVLAAPITPSTSALINQDRMARMKPDACLINVSRGPLLDHQALAEALRTKQIAGAALDVFDKEPLPPDSPLWEVPNLLITPHTAALTDKLWERHFALFSENLRRYLHDEPLLATVDKRKGY